MSERDVAEVTSRLSDIRSRKFYNMVVTRLLPDKFPTIEKLDRVALMILGPLGRFVAGRVVLIVAFRKT